MMQKAPAGGRRNEQPPLCTGTASTHWRRKCAPGARTGYTQIRNLGGAQSLFVHDKKHVSGWQGGHTGRGFSTSHLCFLMGSVCCLMTSACYFSFLPLSLTLTRIRTDCIPRYSTLVFEKMAEPGRSLLSSLSLSLTFLYSRSYDPYSGGAIPQPRGGEAYTETPPICLGNSC